MAVWWEIDIHTTEEAAEAIADLLLREGAKGVATEDPDEITAIVNAPDTLIFTDPQFLEDLPDYVRIRGYFSTEDEAALQIHLSQAIDDMRAFLDVGQGLVALTQVDEKDWANAWKQHYHPLRVSKRLTICPSWEDYKAAEGEIVIRLDPGSAFGTGEHATTALCMEALDEAELSGKRLLDLGCGSGILAIAAAKLGAGLVEAVDIDPNAVQVSVDNAKQNGCFERISNHVGELKNSLESHYDFIVANILAEVHLHLAQDYVPKLAPQGQLILGGIIQHKAKAVKEALEKTGLRLLSERSAEDWTVLSYLKD